MKNVLTKGLWMLHIFKYCYSSLSDFDIALLLCSDWPEEVTDGSNKQIAPDAAQRDGRVQRSRHEARITRLAMSSYGICDSGY